MRPVPAEDLSTFVVLIGGDGEDGGGTRGNGGRGALPLPLLVLVNGRRSATVIPSFLPAPATMRLTTREDRIPLWTARGIIIIIIMVCTRGLSLSLLLRRTNVKPLSCSSLFEWSFVVVGTMMMAHSHSVSCASLSMARVSCMHAFPQRQPGLRSFVWGGGGA
jgi:hypothetical protein